MTRIREEEDCKQCLSAQEFRAAAYFIRIQWSL